MFFLHSYRNISFLFVAEMDFSFDVFMFRMAPEVAAVERKGGYNQLCDVWAVSLQIIFPAQIY